MSDLPISGSAVDRWIHQGFLRLPLPGSGTRRDYPDAEVRAMRSVDSLRRLAGVNPIGLPWPSQTYDLARNVAEAARSNPAGTVVEIPSPCAYVRHILVVPDA